MNQLLRKTSFVSGLLLMFAPIIFSSVLKFVLGLKSFLYTFSPDQMVLYVIFLIVSILEIIFFIKIFKSYRLREPHAYYLVYFLGILTTLGMLGASLLGAYQYLQVIKIIFFFILLFALFSFRYQKENFFATTNTIEVRKNVLISIFLMAVISVASYYISVYFISEYFIFPYFLPALISLVLIPWWRKKVISGTLHRFIFLPTLQVIVMHLVLQLFSFWNFFQVLRYLGKI